MKRCLAGLADGGAAGPHPDNYPGRTGDVQVNLYLCGDVIVGGDIMALGENGFQASLLYPAEDT